MDVDRQSFIIYKNFYEPIKHLNNTDLGKLFRAIFEYNLSVPGTEKSKWCGGPTRGKDTI